ncbi:MAG: tripartite tricarboxylate transporter substrate binding protein, partial [Burkholderiales bacterium]
RSFELESRPTHAEEDPLSPVIVGALTFVFAGAVTAQTFPSKQVRLVIPFPPSGMADTLGRVLAQDLQKTWGQPVVADNRPGASGNIAAEHVARAAPDGHTLFMGHIGTHGVNPALFSKLPYDPVKDFAPVSLLVSVSNLMLAHPSVPANNLAELLALARAKPGALTYASPGAGTSGHMSGELLKSMAKVDLVHVPYKGQGPATQDLLGGQVNLLFDTVFSQLGNVRAGRLKALGITSGERSPLAPEVATIAEQGLPGYQIGPWFALFVTAGTPADIVAKLNIDVVRALTQDDVAKRFTGQGATVHASSAEALAQHVRNEIAKWGPIVRASGAKAD